MQILRTATLQDAAALAAIEAACFPPAEAAGSASLQARLQTFGRHFYLLEQDGRAIGFINGMVTSRPTIDDELYDNAALHEEDGAYQSVFGLDVLPGYRRQGHAARLMWALIAAARFQGRKGCILTCKQPLIAYYQRFGYRCGGVSASVHGGAKWYDMTLLF